MEGSLEQLNVLHNAEESFMKIIHKKKDEEQHLEKIKQKNGTFFILNLNKYKVG